MRDRGRLKEWEKGEVGEERGKREREIEGELEIKERREEVRRERGREERKGL